MVVTLERRRRRSQQRNRAFHLRAHDCDVAPVVPGSFFLFVTVLLFFIDNDQPEILERRKNRRPCSHNHARLAVPHTPPFSRPLYIAQRRVQYRYALKLRPKPRAALPPDPQRQRNLGDQHDRRLPPRQRLLYRAQIHFRFPAAGYAVQQQHAELAELEPRANRLHGALLFFVQFMRGWLVPCVERILRRINRLFPAFQQTLAQHAFDHRPRNLRQLQQLRHRQWPTLCFEQHPYLLFFFPVSLFDFSPSAFPCDHVLRLPLSSLQALANLDQPAPLQPLQRGAVHAELRCATQRQLTLLPIYPRNKSHFFCGAPIREL